MQKTKFNQQLTSVLQEGNKAVLNVFLVVEQFHKHGKNEMLVINK